MKYLYVSSLISGLIAFSPMAHAISLKEVMDAAKGYNFNIKAQNEKLKISSTEKAEGYTKFLPSVMTQTSFIKNHYIIDTYRSSAYNDPHTTTHAILVKQSVFNGGADAYGIQVLDHSLVSSKQDLKSVVNNIMLKTIQAYEDLSTKRKVLELNEENVKVYKEVLSLNKTRFELGEITSTDIAQTEARLLEAQSNKEVAKSDLMAAEANFKDVVGMEAPKKLDPVKLDDKILPKTLAELLQAINTKNPSLISAMNQSEASKKGVDIAYSQLMPKVDASVAFNSINKTKNQNNSGTTYTLQVSMPIFQSGAEYTNIKKSRHRREESKYKLSQLKTSLEAQAITAWNNYSISASILKARKKSIIAAEKSLSGIREEAKMGTRTTLDVLTEQANLFQTQVAYRRAIQNNIISYYSIVSLIGELDNNKYI